MTNTTTTKTTTRYTFEAKTDERTVCDCCGKTGLKGTVVLKSVATGEFVFFGTTCAARALSNRNVTASVAKTQIENLVNERAAFDARVTNVVSAIRDRGVSPRSFLNRTNSNEIARGMLTYRHSGFEAVISFLPLVREYRDSMRRLAQAERNTELEFASEWLANS